MTGDVSSWRESVQVNNEKVDLENQLEVEQEYIVNKLHKELDHLRAERLKLNREKIDLENQLEAEQEYIVNKLQKQVRKLIVQIIICFKDMHLNVVSDCYEPKCGSWQNWFLHFDLQSRWTCSFVLCRFEPLIYSFTPMNWTISPRYEVLCLE